MILDIDIGNTRVKWRLSQAGEAKSSGAFPLGELESGLWAIRSEARSVGRVRASCVAGPAVERRLDDWTQQHLGVPVEFARVLAGLGGVAVAYAEPQRLGVDRWLAILASHASTAGPCIVIDAGSALTADFLAEDGVHLGGLILPGAQMMQRALLERTYAVRPEALTLPQNWSPGCDTVACVANGIAAALSGLVQEVIRYGENRCGNGLVVLACGGDAALLAAADPRVNVHPDLVLDGLALALPTVPSRHP